MNVESILSKIDLFEDLVIKSGFNRDIDDFLQSIQQAQNRNLVFMKDLSESIKTAFYEFADNALESELEMVLRDSIPFTDKNTLNKLIELDSDTEIDANQYYQQLNGILNELNNSLEENANEINSVKEIFEKYVSETADYQSNEEQALISLIFKDSKSTGSLKEFSKALNRWDRTILIYHTLLKSDSPSQVKLVEIQNGSIDVIFNIDLDIAIDLTDLITTGLKVYGAYLLYKSSRAKEIIDSYLGNKKLIKMEEERETLMLDNIKESVKQKALEQHKENLKSDKKIDKTGSDKKADEVSNVITDHIVKGNEVRLLTPPKVEGQTEQEDPTTELRKESTKVRERYKSLAPEDKQLLLEKYSIKEEDTDETA